MNNASPIHSSSAPRVLLRPVEESDLPRLAAQAADLSERNEFEGSMMRGPQFFKKRFAEDGFSSNEAERLVVCDADNGEPIGSASHFLAHRYSSARELGWKIDDPARRGQGWGTAAARALIDHVFHNFEVHRVCAALAPGNLASRRVAEKAGLQFEGRLRGVIFINGLYLDSEVFGLLRPEWQARCAATLGRD